MGIMMLIPIYVLPSFPRSAGKILLSIPNRCQCFAGDVGR